MENLRGRETGDSFHNRSALPAERTFDGQDNTYREGTNSGGTSKTDSDGEEAWKDSSAEDNNDRDSQTTNEVEKEHFARGIQQLAIGPSPDLEKSGSCGNANRTESMESITSNPSAYGAGAITLEAAHPDAFYGGSMKARIFLQQVDNKINDAAGASEGMMIRYAISLLRGTAAEWAATHTDEEGRSTFQTYRDFRKRFLLRFTDPNPTGTAIEKLLNIKQGRMGIQEYCTKAVNLSNQAGLGTAVTKALIFRGIHVKDQDRVMLANSIYSDEDLGKESVDDYLQRIARLIRREEVKRGGWRAGEGGRTDGPVPQATWGHGEDPMEIDKVRVGSKETRKCFKCGKTGHIQRFCRNILPK